jgi:phosphomevalonate kinase
MGRSASTTELVSQVRSLRASQPRVYTERLRSISHASSSAFQALCYGPSDERQRAFCDATEEGARAIRALSEASGAPIWTPEHSALKALLSPLGASVKPTGAGGGDLALACAPTLEAHQRLLDTCAEVGWELIEL